MGVKTTYTCDSCEAEIKFPASKNYESFHDTPAAGLEIEVNLRGLHHGCSNSATGIWQEEKTMLLCKNCRQRFISKIRSLFPKFFEGA